MYFFSFGFFDRNEVFFTACRSDSIRKIYSLKKGLNRIRLTFDKLPLSKGEYSFNLVAYQGTVVQDWIKNAGMVMVEAGDYYGTGVLPAFGRQGVLVDYNWS